MNEEQLRSLEATAETFFGGSDPNQKAAAQQQLVVLGSSVDYIPQCQYILEHSSNQYAILVATNSLQRLITEHWNSFSDVQRVDIRNYLLTFLAEKCENLQHFVIASIIQLIARITKLGWLDSSSDIRDIVSETSKFLQASGPHAIIGLRLLNELVTEMNHGLHKRTFTQHRKVAVSFRDHSLLQVFEVALSMLKQVSSGSLLSGSEEIHNQTFDQSLKLAVACLSYDFIGTKPDESAEDAGAIQIPTSWRAQIQDPTTMRLFFRLYRGCATGIVPTDPADSGTNQPAQIPQNPHHASTILEVLVYLVTVRRSLFSSESDRKQYLQVAISGIIDILQDNLGMSSQDCFHQFCRLLGRLKSSYQLTELIQTPGYTEWLPLASKFTAESFKEMHASGESVHYLLGMWSKMVAALPYIRPDSKNVDPMLQQYTPSLVHAYIHARLSLVPRELSGDVESFDLDDTERVQEQVEQLPGVFRFLYSNNKTILFSFLDPLLQRYTELIPLLRPDNPSANDSSLQQSANVIEVQIAWLVYMIGAIIGGQNFGTSQSDSTDCIHDADLCKRVITLMVTIDKETSKFSGQVKADHRLESALLYFLSCFRKTFLAEQHGMPIPSGSAHSQKELVDPDAASSSESPSRRSSYSHPINSIRSSRQKLFQSFFTSMGLGDHLVVVAQIIQKLTNTLRFYGEDEQVIKTALNLFQDLTLTYGNIKMLLSLEVVQDLLSQHTADQFRFLQPPENGRHRTTWYASLSRMLYLASDPDSLFERFAAPLLLALDKLLPVVNQRHEEVAKRLSDAARDWRGILISVHNSRTYTLVFEALYPKYIPLFVAAVSTWADTPRVVVPILKMFSELVSNRTSRINFDSSSPNGILLFREASKLVVNYGNAALQLNPSDDIYQRKLKGISVCFMLMARALDGGYVNFGVFKLYNDSALEEALQMLVRLITSIEETDLLTYPKLSSAYFFLIHVLFKNHIDYLASLPQQTFQYLCGTLKEGMESLDTVCTNHAACAVDMLATYYVRNAKRNTPVADALREQLRACPNLMESFMQLLFQILVFGEAVNQWTLARPLLPLILASEDIRPDAWKQFKENVVSTQVASSGAQTRLLEEFNHLMNDITRSLDTSNRDRLTQHLALFRLAVRDFVTT